MVSKYLIYALIDPDSGRAFYVGKSTEGDYRARRHVIASALRQDDRMNPPKAVLIRALQARHGGLGYEIQVLAELPGPARGASAPERLPHASALGLLERVMIRAMRTAGAELLNRTDGGENVVGTFSGKRHSVKIRAQISASKIGFRHSPESLRRMSKVKAGNQYGKGHKVSPEARQKISAAMKEMWKRRLSVVSVTTEATPEKQQTSAIASGSPLGERS